MAFCKARMTCLLERAAGNDVGHKTGFRPWATGARLCEGFHALSQKNTYLLWTRPGCTATVEMKS